MQQVVRIILAATIAVAVTACSHIRYLKEPDGQVAVVDAPGGKKITYTYPLGKARRFAYTVNFVKPNPTSEWSPAIWFAFDHKDAPQAYQLMLFQDSDGSIRPEIRLLDVADQRDHVSIEPDIHFAAVDSILVEIEVRDQLITPSINGHVLDSMKLGFPIDQLRVGFSSGSFSINGELAGTPVVGS